jgi:spore germination cell wall hydrolase CwlJ-like protein
VNSDFPADRAKRDSDHSLKWLLEVTDTPAAVRSNRWRDRPLQIGALRIAPRFIAAALALVMVLIVAGALLWRTDHAPTSNSNRAHAADNARVRALLDAPFSPAALRPLSARDAEAWNATVPEATAPNPAARVFMLGLAKATDYERSRACLTSAVYYEAGNEPLDGQRAVAQVILNRLRHPAFPHTVCGVVFQGVERKLGCQFTFTCDGAMARKPGEKAWARAQGVADAALGGYVYSPVGWATHYHANYVVPYWAASLAKVATIGAHVFYRWGGRSGTAETFDRPYAGSEPDVRLLMALPSAAPTDEAARGAAPFDVTETERPVLIRGTPVQGQVTGPTVPRASVGDAQRWILAGPARDKHGPGQVPVAGQEPLAAQIQP